MRKKLDSYFLAAGLVLAILPGPGNAQKAEPREAIPKRLVRFDLLTPPPAESRPVRRDVFSPASDSAAALASVGLPVAPAQPGSSGPPGAAAANPPPSGGEPPVYIPSIRYIGYVDFGRKITALVIAEGQPLAVDEKEELLPGYRVVAITAERIEIEDPSGTKRPYLREGEQP